MKTIKLLLVLAAAVCLVLSCSKYEGDEMNVNLKKSNADPISVIVPFKADFVGTYMYAGPEASCGEWNPGGGIMWGMVINEGGGTGTQLGRFKHYFEFCCEFISGIYPAHHMVAYFTAANGDILYVSCAGQVIEGKAPDHPDYVVSYFRDPFVILGGTGRFEGATGSGWTDDYNSSEDPNSHHHWSGTITLVKGNR